MKRAESSARPLRVDAVRNRDRIVQAAQAVFAKHGLDVSMDEVAREAGVGVATVYRRFPRRTDLVAAAFTQKIGIYAQVARTAFEAEDPWQGFVKYIYTVCGMQAADAGLTDVLVLTFPETPGIEAQREEAQEILELFIERVRKSGRLRPDFEYQDLVLLLMANAGLVNGMRRDAPDAWRRFAAYMIDAFEAPARGELPPPPTEDQARAAMSRAARRAADSTSTETSTE
jgi:AcrR family transcriptional regulator